MEEITVYREETERIQSLHETLMVRASALMARTDQMEHIIDMEPSIQITMPSGETYDFKVALARLHKDALEDHVGATFGRRILQLLSQTTLSS